MNVEWLPFTAYMPAHLLSHVRFFSNLMDCSPQAPVSVECSRQEYWSGLPFPIPGALPDPGMEPASLALAGGVFSSEPPGKPHLLINTGKLIASKCHCSKEWGYLDHLCIFGRGSKCAMGRRQVWEGNSRLLRKSCGKILGEKVDYIHSNRRCCWTIPKKSKEIKSGDSKIPRGSPREMTTSKIVLGTL